ncbi:PrsW family intramembrane metalloprotease [Auraticoccus monumenti]|uniref:Membrane proteinase PrsW, cleaves anti-sigma factor RsiW, M82 family n=1 Tax=Auraticoccus monumenti TaxID=675864 RepID=A0A1G7DLQ8_9ACTN|nr:zinc ribbon domain-containing protein [Auraticoccus monumenti]SDE51745.1 Membrane proteinase PrsW, cleaves anti-sigma factor RsiW, M82 family [Auraticoccus monumenti]
MDCPRCQTQLPDVAHFCHHCGLDVRSTDVSRRKSFAVKPDEPVASFSLVSTIMPRGVSEHPQTYRLALVVALTLALVTAIFGALPLAVMIAAFAIPIVYIVYLYDVNLWEDEPVPVVALAFVLTGALSLLFTIAWTMLRGETFRLGGIDASGGGLLGPGPQVTDFLLAALLVPLVGEALRQVGPLLLASRPHFDDLMDGLTFGIISGVAYASFDTVVKHWDLVTGGGVGTDEPGMWASLIFLEGFVKPIVMGTATGIACAEFSGLGRGYDGFTPRYWRGLLEAVVANVLYGGGVYLFGFVGSPTLGVLLSVIWGLLIAAVLILRVRNVLHHGLMEAALEAEAREELGEAELQFCRRCEMPLVSHAVFCNACGAALRVQQSLHPERHRVHATAGAPGTTAPAAEAPATEAVTAEGSPPQAGERPAASAAPPPGGAGPAARPPGRGEPGSDSFFDQEAER